MDKLEMRTKSISQENIEKIRALFPNAVTEIIKDGKVTLAVDFDVLKQELSESLITEGQERYQMTWPDKKKSVVLANSAISATLRPCKEESVDFDTTQNLYIEGDNLDVLKLLRETYLCKVKMIYIDPPYNTGNDFIYEDDFAQDSDEYLGNSGQYDEQGNRLVKNLDSNGRFHTDWLNMIYPRLKVAKDLLADDGVIFISIDDNEVENLKKVCDEIFGENNFVGQLILKTATDNNQSQINTEHEYMMCFAKCKITQPNWVRQSEAAEKIISQYRLLKNKGLSCSEIQSKLRDWIRLHKEELPQVAHYNNVDDKGVYSSSSNSSNPHPGGYMFDIIHPVTGLPCPKPENGWRWPEKTFLKYAEMGEIEWGKDHTTQPHVKKRIETSVEYLRTLIYEDNRATTKMVAEIFGGRKVFDNPKPLNVLKRIIEYVTDKDSIIFDFFSGSATTAHAVMQLNAEDGGKRKFIMVQLPEPCDEKSEAYKAGYKNICEIGKERIRRAGKKIKDGLREEGLLEMGLDYMSNLADIENNADIDSVVSRYENLDIGFRVLKLDSSNMQDVYYNPSVMTQSLLDSTVDNVKPDRMAMDLLFQVMLELGVELSAKIEEKEFSGKKYYIVNENEIIACFDDNLNNEVITEIAKLQPLYAVFKDKSFATDSVGINNEQIFKTYAPSTTVKVI